MATTAVIDIEQLLAPIEGENPAGRDLSSTGIIDELKELRRSDDITNLGEWAPKELKAANWDKVVKVASKALASQSKDILVSAYLSEGVVQMHGLAGLRDSLRLVREMQERYWENCYPLAHAVQSEDGDDDEGGISVRAAAVAKLDTLLPPVIRFIKISKSIQDRPPMTPDDWETSAYYDNLLLGDEKAQAAYREAVGEGKPTGEIFRKAISMTSKDYYKNLVEDLDASTAELKQLNELIQERYREADDLPVLSAVQKSLDSFHHMISDIEKITGPLRAVAVGAGDEGKQSEDAGAGSVRAKFTGEGIPQQPVDRADALRRLQAVATYFRSSEPHSPVTYLVERAIAWAAMPLDQWLAEVVKDQAILSNIRETLGVRAPDEG